jgi:hypothetical protein
MGNDAPLIGYLKDYYHTTNISLIMTDIEKMKNSSSFQDYILSNGFHKIDLSYQALKPLADSLSFKKGSL